MKINYKTLQLKMHFFFFLGSTGSIFPFLHVYGKQIGISPSSIGSVVAILPVIYLIAKPLFGFIMDRSKSWKKVFFISLLVIANSCFGMILFLPPLPGVMPAEYYFQNISCILHCDMNYHATAIRSCNGTKDRTCHWVCKNTNFSLQLSFHADRNETVISPNTACLLNANNTSLCQENVTSDNCNVTCTNFDDDYCLFTSIIYWGFVLLLCFGDSAAYIFFSLNDTVCFMILGEGKQLKYGKQRLWGAVGFGVAACLTGYLIDLWSQGAAYKSYVPSMLLLLILTCIDLICCIKLKLPFQSESTTILKDVFMLLKSKYTVMFLCSATCLGIVNSILRNFLFWYLEDLAIETGYMDNIKLIEGLIAAVQSIGGEMVFFYLSGKILKKLGYGYTIIFSFICYVLRLGLISLAPMPWWILAIEFLQGPSYALCLTSVVSYASVIAPPGASATFQGLVQGFIDGLGLSIGSLMGGFLYKKYGGLTTLRIFAVFAAFSALMHYIFHTLYLKHKATDVGSNIKWSQSDDAQRFCVVAET